MVQPWENLKNISEAEGIELMMEDEQGVPKGRLQTGE
jgi:hypothetical protein